MILTTLNALRKRNDLCLRSELALDFWDPELQSQHMMHTPANRFYPNQKHSDWGYWKKQLKKSHLTKISWNHTDTQLFRSFLHRFWKFKFMQIFNFIPRRLRCKYQIRNFVGKKNNKRRYSKGKVLVLLFLIININTTLKLFPWKQKCECSINMT